MAGSEALISGMMSLSPAIVVTAWLPRLFQWLSLSDPGISWAGLQDIRGVQETAPAPGAELFMGSKVLMKQVPVVVGLLCSLDFYNDCPPRCQRVRCL